MKLQQTTDHTSPRALQSLPTVALSISEFCKYIMIIKLAWAYNCHKIIFGAKQTSRVSSTSHTLLIKVTVGKSEPVRFSRSVPILRHPKSQSCSRLMVTFDQTFSTFTHPFGNPRYTPKSRGPELSNAYLGLKNGEV